jgi:hypothetical protein
MVKIDFTYEGVNYVGYQIRTLYSDFIDNSKIVQLFLFKTEQDVDTKFISVVTQSTDMDVIVQDAINIILGQ